MVSVGYIDPGNWATDLEGGARFGHQLLWVLVVSNLMALLLQSLSAKLGLVTGLDLASACRLGYSPRTNFGLWLLAEIAIVACDLAELLGSAIALNLLFGLPLVLGAALTSLDVLVILGLQRWGAGPLQAVVFALLLTISCCLAIELVWAKPDLGLMSAGLVPRLDGASLYVAIGILGATVMPHNLYLQSGLLRHAGPAPDVAHLKRQLRRCFWSTALALNLALLVNAAILILAATVFASRNLEVAELSDAYRLLAPLLGTSLASVLFAVGLLCAGQSASVTGTLAGQIVMEGFLDLRIAPWLRRVITRSVAIVPALVVLSIAGHGGVMPLLIGSQVLLSLQLPFAVVPLLRFTSARGLMGPLASRPGARHAAVACAALIVLANAWLVVHTARELSGTSPLLAWLLGAAGVAGLGFLGYVAWVPLHLAAARRDQGGPANQTAPATNVDIARAAFRARA